MLLDTELPFPFIGHGLAVDIVDSTTVSSFLIWLESVGFLDELKSSQMDDSVDGVLD